MASQGRAGGNSKKASEKFQAQATRNIRSKNDSGGIWEEGKGNVTVMRVIFLSSNASADSPVMTETARKAERGAADRLI